MTQLGALATIFDGQGRVLLVHQTYSGNKWAWPGGAVEPNEAPWEAAAREVKEETGLVVQVGRLVSIYTFTDRDHVGFQFICRIAGGNLEVDGAEISEAAFFDPAHLPVPMTVPGRQRLADALANCSEPFLRVFERVDVIQG